MSAIVRIGTATVRIGSLEASVLKSMARHNHSPVPVEELRQQVFQQYKATNNHEGLVKERSFSASFSRALRGLEQKGLLQLNRRPNVSRWPEAQREGAVFLVALNEQPA